MEKNQIKYPIDDKLIQLMPELHKQMNQREPPNLKKVLIDSDKFENLLYIWEFLNNFKDFLDMPKFSLEELQASLNFTTNPNSSEIEQSFEK